MSDTIVCRGIFFRSDKEEAYFGVTLTLPRVGESTFSFCADRYMAHYGREQHLTPWRVIRHGNTPAGVGEKTLAIVREKAERLVNEWIASDAFAPAFSSAVTQYIVRTIRVNSPYAIQDGRKALEQHKANVAPANVARITEALRHLETAQGLLTLATEEVN